jgi:hypothetical protein
MINVVIDSYMGFSQKLDKHTGFDDLYATLVTQLSGKARVINIPHRWNSWVGVDAKQVARHSTSKTYHVRIGYSYGGYAAYKRCEADSKLGITVDRLFLIDAVWRLKTARWSWLARLSSVVGKPKFKIPPNVKNVTCWRQKVNLPAGHEITVQDDGHTILDDRSWVDVPHNDMDNDHSIHSQIATEISNDLATH